MRWRNRLGSHVHRFSVCDPRHTTPSPPRRMLAWSPAALALTGTDGRGIVPPSVFARSEADTDGRGWGGGLRRGVMGDDAATAEQLRAELRRQRELHAAEVARLEAENAALRAD